MLPEIDDFILCSIPEESSQRIYEISSEQSASFTVSLLVDE